MSSASRSRVLALVALLPILVLVLILLTNDADDSSEAPQPVVLSDVLARLLPELLADITLPADANSVVRAFNQLPETLSGRSRLDMPFERAPDTFSIAYGEGQHRTGQSPLRLTVQNV